MVSISFLVYVISSAGLVMDDGKTDAVVHWPTPQSIKNLQRLLGFANFY